MTTTMAIVVTAAVMLGWNLLAHAGRDRVLPVAGPVAAGLLLWVGRAAGLSWGELGLGVGTMFRGLVWGGATLGMILVAYAVGLALPFTRRLFLDKRYERITARSALYLALLAVPLGTVVFEEVAFRGVLWGLVAGRWGAPCAIAVTSALFGVWHVVPALDMARSNQDPVAPRSRSAVLRLVLGTVVFTGLSGVVFGVLRQQSGSLLAPALLHWATNGLGVLGAALAWRLHAD
jgi:membrane protease YdiL (CAAX protease family)